MLKTRAGQELADTHSFTQKAQSSGAQAPRHGHHSDRARTIRGGRITKFKGQAASFASGAGWSLSAGSLGAAAAVLALTIGLTAMASTPAMAGTCVLVIDFDDQGAAYVCSGPASDNGTDDPVSITSDGEDIRVFTTSGFGQDSSATSSEDTFNLVANGDGSIEFRDDFGSDISSSNVAFDSGNFAINATANGSGDINIVTTGTVSGAVPIIAEVAGGSDTKSELNITVEKLNGSFIAMYVSTQRSGKADVSVLVTDEVIVPSNPENNDGITVLHLADEGDVSVRVTNDEGTALVNTQGNAIVVAGGFSLDERLLQNIYIEVDNIIANEDGVSSYSFAQNLEIVVNKSVDAVGAAIVASNHDTADIHVYGSLVARSDKEDVTRFDGLEFDDDIDGLPTEESGRRSAAAAIQVDGDTENGTTTINLYDGADISSGSGVAVSTSNRHDGDTIVNVYAGATVRGAIWLGNGLSGELGGDHIVNFAGGDLAYLGQVDGGTGLLGPERRRVGIEDPDSFTQLNFNGSSGEIIAENFTRWSQISIGDGSVISVLGEQALSTDLLRLVDKGTLSFADDDTTGRFTLGDQPDADIMLDNQPDWWIITSNFGDGNFEGAGGTLVFDVDFANGAADQMIIEGDVTGTALIGVNPLSVSTEPGDPIVLITVGGAVDQTAFALPGGFYETPFYTYALSADIGADESIFFLGNLFDDNGDPILSSTARLYEVASSALLGAVQLPGLVERVAWRALETEDNPAIEALGYAASPNLAEVLDGSDASGAWMHVEGDWQNLAYASTDYRTELDTQSYTIRFGGALERAMAVSRLVLGAQGSVLWMINDASLPFGSGSIDTNGFTLGASATWLHATGFYADAQIEFGQLTSDIASSGFGNLAEDLTTGTTAFSFEIGKAFDLTPNSVLIPQAQLQVGRVSTDDFTDNSATLVSFGDDTSTTGRLGVLYQYSGSGYNLFAEANAIGDFSGEQDVEYGGLDLGVDPEAFWGEIEIGGSFSLNERATLFGSASYRTTLGSNGDSGGGGSVSGGFSISF